MGFIERLRQRLESETQARQQHAESLQLAKQEGEAVRIQREAGEAEIHTQRRKQAEAFWQESGVGILLDKLEELIKIDSSKAWSFKAHLWPKKKPDPPPDMGEGVDTGAYAYALRPSREEGGLIAAIKPGTQGPNSGSVCEAVSWWDGEGKVVKDFSTREAVNRLVHQFYKYVGVEASPDGNITFHFKTRKSVPISAWKANRDILENTLGEAYGKPGIYTIEERQWTHGPQARMS